MPEPHTWQAIGWISLVVFSLAAGLNQVMRLVDRVKGEPPSGELHLSARQLEARVTELEKNRDEDRRTASERRKFMFEQMDKDRALFRAEIKDIYHRIEASETRVNESLRALPNELIATLRNTGVIRT